MPSPIRPSFAAPHLTYADPVEPRPAAAETLSDAYEILPQTPSSASASQSRHTLQTPTGTLQLGFRTTSGPDSTLPIPSYPPPTLTRASLQAWQDAPGLTDVEYGERSAVAEKILRLAVHSTRTGANPGSLKIDGHLDLHGHLHLTQLPAGLNVTGDLDCSECINLTQLPDALKVGGDLCCKNCPNLTHLPARLSVGGCLDCGNCAALTKLPVELSVGSDLICSGCTRLTQLSEGLSVQGSLFIDGCTNLTQLPEGLSVRDDLYCSRCTNLTQLPERLSVGGILNCTGCTGLTYLPAELSVGGNLNFNDCTSLTELPAALSIGGHLGCDNCTSLTSLPSNIATWGPLRNGRTRLINLSGSGLSPTLRERLEQVDAPGMRFHFSNAPAAPVDMRFADLGTAAAFWFEKAQGRTTPDLKAWTDVSVRDCDFLRQFLGRLCDTADYQHPDARVRLAGRVCDLFQAMDESPNLRRTCSDCISDALQTCNDRVIWAMNQVEIAVRIHQASHAQEDGAKLRELVLSFMRLDIVQDHARQKVNTLTWVDEIEVFLAYESGLREALKLPVSAEHMLFARCAQVTQADLDGARDAADAAMQDPNKVAAYLQTSAPWQHYLRRQEAKQWAWEHMAPEPWPQGLKADELQCAITLENFAQLTQPVLAPSGSTWHAYEAQALLTHWIEHGTDVYNQKLELAGLRRPAMS